MSYWEELKRRNVVRVGAAYGVLAWLIAQIASVFAPALSLPEWVMPFVVFVLVLGFPIALFLAWAFELTPDGLRRTEQAPAVTGAPRPARRTLDYAIVVLLALAVGFMALDTYLRRLEVRAEAGAATTGTAADLGLADRAATSESPAGAPGGRMPRSVAVLPFDNLSLDPDDAYFAVGLHEEILNQLAQLRRLNVISRTSVLRYAGQRPAIPEIAADLNVETVMEGSVRYAASRILVTVQLIDGQSDTHIWSETYPGDVGDVDTIFALQGDIARHVAEALEAELSPEDQRRLTRPPTASPEAYELYLAAIATGSDNGAAIPRRIELIDRALALDPQFALGWALKSGLHSNRPLYEPDRTAEQQALGEEAARRALALDPELAEAHAALGLALQQRLDWIGAERAYRRAFALGIRTADQPGYTLIALGVGHFERARSLLEESRRTDPRNLVALSVLMYATYLGGDRAAIDSQYALGKTIDATWRLGDDALRYMLIGRGDVDRARAIPSADGITPAMLERLDAPAQAVAELRRLAAGPDYADPSAQMRIAVWAGYFGDTTLALEALRASKTRSAINAYLMWLPQLEAARQLPEFRALLRDIGIVAYWEEFGWPAMCHRTTDDDFACG